MANEEVANDDNIWQTGVAINLKCQKSYEEPTDTVITSDQCVKVGE